MGAPEVAGGELYELTDPEGLTKATMRVRDRLLEDPWLAAQLQRLINDPEADRKTLVMTALICGISYTLFNVTPVPVRVEVMRAPPPGSGKN